MGKGDHRRPLDVDPQEFADNWERIFKREQKEAKEVLENAMQEVFSKEGVDLLEDAPDGSVNINVEGNGG